MDLTITSTVLPPPCSHSSTALMHNSWTSKDYDWLVATNFHGNLQYWRPAYPCRFCCRLCAAWSSFCGCHECSWVPRCGNWLWWRWGFHPPRWWSVGTLKHQNTGQLSGDSVQTAQEGIRYRQLRGYEVWTATQPHSEHHLPASSSKLCQI